MSEELRAIHQFHPSITYGDAISNDCFELQRHFWSSGLSSEVYAAETKVELRAFTRDLAEIEAAARPGAALLIHHSMGADSLDAAAGAPFERRAVVYHNIAPAHFFEGVSDHNRDHAALGREQLKTLASACELGIADSEFNREELAAAGFRKTAVVPILVDWAAYDVPPDPRVLAALADERTNVLVVGQLMPHKAVHDVLPAFARYRERDPGARLFIVGSSAMAGPYLGRLRDDVTRLGIEESVTFTGRVSMPALAAYYRSASVVLTLSDHEGFCVPILEAMRYERPIVAHAAGAVPETLGDAGILLKSKGPGSVADALERAVRDDQLRAKLVARGRARLAEFSRERVVGRLHDAFEQAGWSVPRARARTIAIVSSGERCGIHHYSLALADGLRADGQDVTFVGVDRADTADLFRKLGRLPGRTDVVIVEHEAGIFREVPFIRALYDLRRRGFDVVLSLHELEPDKFHAYRMLAQALHYRMDRSLPKEVLRIPVVGVKLAWRFVKYRSILTLTGLLPKRIVVHSKRSLFWSDLLTSDRAKVQEIPLVTTPLEDTTLPRDADEKRALRRRLRLPQDAFVFVSPGFFFRRKRFLEVIGALPSGALLVLSGTAASWERDYFDEVNAFIRERRLENVILNTEYDRMGEYVAAADCVVLYYEDVFQSAVATQAIWAGLPCIFSDVPGFQLYRGAGLFARDTQGLHDAMREIQRPETYARLVEQVHVLRHRLSPERLGPRYLAGLPPR